jgi:hypothetical protein
MLMMVAGRNVNKFENSENEEENDDDSDESDDGDQDTEDDDDDDNDDDDESDDDDDDDDEDDFGDDIHLPDSHDSNSDSDESDQGGSAWRTEKWRWPKNAKNQVIVPYEIDEKQEYSDEEIGRMKEAMSWIEAGTCVKFQERKKEEIYLFITMINTGCWTFVGRLGATDEQHKKQTVNFCHKCTKYVGRMAHEFMHTLGFFHMHSHTDRDQYVEVFEDNIDPKIYKANYKVVHGAVGTNFDTPYDYASIMHYGPKSYSLDKKNPTMRALKNPDVNDAKMGQYTMSKGDTERVNAMYECRRGTKRKNSEVDDDDDDDDDDDESEENDDDDSD